MRMILILWAIAAFTGSLADVQPVKTAKAPSRFIYIGGDSRRYHMLKDAEPVGVCYIEVPTVQLFTNVTNIPAGNGSRSDLSRIRTCCHGFTRNIHDYTVCEPVCSNGCVNSLCVAPEICDCYPDYVKNSVGECTATCPIGCKNGQCRGSECVCDSGYKLDADGKYCMPSCDDNCGGFGNCTAPNSCACQPGYIRTDDGSCKPVCENCEDGVCTAPNSCRCRDGYAKDADRKCKPQCTPACPPNANCLAPNVCSTSTLNSPKNSSNLPLHVIPLHPDNQVNNVQHPQREPNQYIYDPVRPYNPYPQHTYAQNHPNDNQEGQIQQRPDNSFHPYQGNSPYPYPNGQNMQPGNLPVNTLNSPQQQGTIQQPHNYPQDPYPGTGPNTMHSSYPRRGDIDSVNDKNPQENITQQSNSYYARGGQQSVELNSMNQYASGSHNSQGTMIQINQGTYNGSQQQSHDFRNQGKFNSTEYESRNNQRSYDSSHQRSYGVSQNRHQSNRNYSSNSYGNFNTDIRNSTSSSHGHDTAFQSNPLSRGTYGSSQDGIIDTSADETQSSIDNRNFDSHHVLYRSNQERENSNDDIQTSINHGTYRSTQQEELDYSRGETQQSTNQGNFVLRHGSYRPNQESNSYHITNGNQANENSAHDMQSHISHGLHSSSQRREFGSIGETQSSMNENFSLDQVTYRSGFHQNTTSDQSNDKYGSTQQESYGFPSENTQSIENEENDDSQRESHYPNQLIYIYNSTLNNSRNGTYGLTRQRSYDSSKQLTDTTSNYENNNTHWESYVPSQELTYHNLKREQNSTYSSSQDSNDSSMGVTQHSTNSSNTSQGEYTFTNPYSLNNSTRIPNAYNQVSDQTVADNSHDEEPCSRPCINGYCVVSYYHNECKCKPGYVPDKLDPYICHPHCPGGCPNGVCVAPRQCHCNDGYTKDTSVKGASHCRKIKYQINL